MKENNPRERKSLYQKFKEYFPWFEPHVKKYKGNRKEGGIDIFLDDGQIMNFQEDTERKGQWVLKRSGRANVNKT